MGLIFKFVLKNISEKKSRTLLIILSILISSGLFFSSNAFAASISKMYDEMLRLSVGTSDIIVKATMKSPSQFFSLRYAQDCSDQTQYVIGTINESADYKPMINEQSVAINLEGITLEDLQTWNPISFSATYHLNSFVGNKIIISQNTASQYGLKAGDTLDLTINSNKQRFLICGIANPVGIFTDESKGLNAIVPKDVLGKLYSEEGKVNCAYVKVKKSADLPQVINSLSQAYNKYDVKEAFSPEQIASLTNQIITPFKLVVAIVTFMCMFIIYSSFKVIIAERLPVIGTLRSVGATRRTTNFILLLESALYGAIGGLLGCGVGIGLLYLMSSAISSGFAQGAGVSVQVNPLLLLSTLIFAFILCLFSSLLPIIQVLRIPVKDIVLNSVEKVKDKKLINVVLGLFFLTTSIVVPKFAFGKMAIVADTACLVISIAGIFLLVPYLISWFIKLTEGIYTLVFGNIGTLALKNLRDNKSMMTSLSLLIIGGASLLMVNTFCSSLTKQLMSIYVDYQKFDVLIEKMDNNVDKNLEHLLYSIDGVTGVYRYFEKDDIKITNKNGSIATIAGIDITKHLDYMRIDSNMNLTDELKQLESERSILLTYTLRDKFNLKIGDVLNLKMSEDKGPIPYTVIGFYNTAESFGDMALVSEKYFQEDTGGQYNARILVKTSKNPRDVENAIKNDYGQYHFSIETRQEEQAGILHQINPILSLLMGFLVLAMFIGLIGIFNNFIIGFISRRRSLGILRSVGMNKLQMMKMILIESATVGILGGITGVLAGILLANNMTYILQAISMRIVMQYSLSYMAASIIVSFAVAVIASVCPALKASQNSIIQSIKFE
ncbi:ABC transporter permease YtrF precursor [Desulfosporosinus acididurans]|uniref:ABC transporter permease YtrF n=1 Tax=Desulfosporosinus acididurans TaxID=476652 RepID=A0A0J1FTQ8_9FIRM|nr:FtsX-like permease family protein [Desulfosporosinus acididurans]KLU66373.1 ABC transporter permease YtrF precursor [Desulfosporosinus acididurans]